MSGFSCILQCRHSLPRVAFLTNARCFPGSLVLRHGHTAEPCCPPVSADSAPSRRNAATFLPHPDSTASFMCPRQSWEHDFKRKLSILDRCYFASFLLLSAVWRQGRSFSELHIRYRKAISVNHSGGHVSQTSTECVFPRGLGYKHCLFPINKAQGRKPADVHSNTSIERQGLSVSTGLVRRFPWPAQDDKHLIWRCTHPSGFLMKGELSNMSHLDNVIMIPQLFQWSGQIDQNQQGQSARFRLIFLCQDFN